MINYEAYNDEKYKLNFWTINRSPYKWFSNYVRLKIFKKWVNEVKDKEVFLDLGGGVGNWAFHFLNDFKKVIVLDVSKEALRKIPEKEIIKKQGSATKIPLKDKSVDCILLADVIEHILPSDLNKVMQELRRILRDDGRVIMNISEYGFGFPLIYYRISGKMRGRLMKSEIHEGHLNRLRFSEIKQLIKRNDFVLEDYRHYGVLFQPLTDFIKDSSAKFIDKLKGNKATREGQIIKDKLKRIENPNLLFRMFFGILSYISYFDILIFGKLVPGTSIFVRLRKNTS